LILLCKNLLCVQGRRHKNQGVFGRGGRPETVLHALEVFTFVENWKCPVNVPFPCGILYYAFVGCFPPLPFETNAMANGVALLVASIHIGRSQFKLVLFVHACSCVLILL
jgi:hypothetical protein